MTIGGRALALSRARPRRPTGVPRPAALAILGVAALAVVVVLGVAAGSVAVAPGDTIGILLRALGLAPRANLGGHGRDDRPGAAPPARPDGGRGRGRPGRGRGDVPGAPAQPARRPLRAGDGVGRRARGGDRRPHPGPHGAPRAGPGQRPRVCRRARCRRRRLPPGPRRPAGATHRAAPHGLRGRLAAGGRPRHDHVPVRLEPAPDLRLPARAASRGPRG